MRLSAKAAMTILRTTQKGYHMVGMLFAVTVVTSVGNLHH